MRFEYESHIPAPPREVFAFHERPDALDILMPPFERSRVVERAKGLAPGNRTVFLTRLAPFVWIRVAAVHTACSPPGFFEDTMEQGPFRFWRHRHLFLPADDGGCRLRDEIEYQPPLGLLGRLLADPLFIRPRLRRIFRWRHEATRRALAHR